MAILTPETMRARFREITAQREAILARSAPLRAERERLSAEADAIRARMAPYEEQVRQMEAPLYDLDVERAQLVKLLNGKTG